MKKILSVLMALIMLMSVFFSFEMNTFAGTSIKNATSISTGFARCSIAVAGTTQYYYFTPSVSATYRFFSESGYDTYGKICYSDGSEITYNDDYNDDTDFYIERYLYSGTTYYFGARMYSSSVTGSFNVFLEKVISDSSRPTGSISAANNVSSTQTMTLSLSDNTGVAGYYWGSNSSYGNNTYKTLSNSITSKPKSTTVRENVTSSGRWYLTVRDTSGNVSDTYSVFTIKTTLNANGGSGVPSYVITKSGNSFTLPTPTKTNYFFDGWGTSLSDISGITGSFTPQTNSTRYAIWKAGMRTTVNINYSGRVVSNYFTPPESGVYDIYSSGSYDTYGVLYDNNSNQLTYNDDGGSGNNFFIKRYLVAGRQYRIDSRMWSASETGSFTVTAEKGYCSHSNLNYIKTVSPTCTARGYDVYECPVCACVFNENYRSAYGHYYGTTTTKATTSKNGSVVTKCARCANVKSRWTIYYPKSIALSKTSYVYNGKVQKPSVTVKDSSGKKIAAGNYTVTYPNGRKNVGKYTVTIKFKGNYTGTVKKTFTINPKGTTLSSVKSPSKGKIQIKWKKGSGVTGYQVQISTKSNFNAKSTKTLSFKASKTSTTGKLTSKKKHYFRIRTYKTVKVNGKNTKIYSSWSKAKSVTVK